MQTADDFLDIDITVEKAAGSFKVGDTLIGWVYVTPRQECKCTVAVYLVETESLISCVNPDHPDTRVR